MHARVKGRKRKRTACSEGIGTRDSGEIAGVAAENRRKNEGSKARENSGAIDCDATAR